MSAKSDDDQACCCTLLAIGRSSHNEIHSRWDTSTIGSAQIPSITATGGFACCHHLTGRVGNLDVGIGGETADGNIALVLGAHGVGVDMNVVAVQRLGSDGGIAHEGAQPLVGANHDASGVEFGGDGIDVVREER